MVTRRDFLKTVGAGAAFIVSGCTEWGGNFLRSGDKRPNFLILFTDDQRFNTINALNNPDVKTPNMDRLVASGTCFTHSYIMGSIHGAVCMPSRAMLMTGRGLFHLPLSVTSTWDVPAEERGRCPYISFPELFRQAGYTTFGTGKQHNGRQMFARGFTDGGKLMFLGMSDHLKVPVYDFDETGEYPSSNCYEGEKFSSELFSDAAIDFLKHHDKDKPFLAYVSYTAPHDPRMAPQKYVDMYPADKIVLPENFLPRHPFDNGELEVRDEKLAPWPRTPEIVKEHIGAYYAMITHLDAQIGRVLDALEDAGLANNTVIVFAGDNGLAVGQHGLMGKQSLYDHSVRVPLILSGPGVPEGKQRDRLCYLHDVFPTICDLAGLGIPESVETKSLVPVMRDNKLKLYDSVLFVYSKNRKENFQRGIRKGDWKLIKYNVGGKVTTQLFDLKNDPWEKRNLADDPKYIIRVEGLTLLLKEKMKASGDICDLDRPLWVDG